MSSQNNKNQINSIKCFPVADNIMDPSLKLAVLPIIFIILSLNLLLLLPYGLLWIDLSVETKILLGFFLILLMSSFFIATKRR